VTRPVGWGVVGCGWVARDYVLPALRATPGARLVGVHDPDPEAAAGTGARTTVHLDELLELRGLDAVYVATPNDAHAGVVAAAVARGVAVLCEKPLAHDVADARAAVAACRATGVVAGTAFDQRFHPAHQRISRLVAQGALGTVTAVRIVYGCWLPPGWSPDGRHHDNWRVDPARAGGGAGMDLAPHGVDLVGALVGEDLTELVAIPRRRVHRYAVDDGTVLAGATPNGVLASLHVSYATPDALPRRRLEVVGTAGQLVALDTMGQTPGGSLTFLDAGGGAAEAIGFDPLTGPFDGQLAAFTAAVAGTAEWAWPIERDLLLHELLVTALAAPTAEKVLTCP